MNDRQWERGGPCHQCGGMVAEFYALDSRALQELPACPFPSVEAIKKILAGDFSTVHHLLLVLAYTALVFMLAIAFKENDRRQGISPQSGHRLCKLIFAFVNR